MNYNKSKIKWACRRGMLELDLFLQKYLDVYLDKMTDEECILFEEFLRTPDPDLYAWFMGYEKPSSDESQKFVSIIQSINNHR